MTTTPTVWKSEFTANEGVTTGAQFNPVSIGLADGRFLTAWADNTNNVDNAPLYDVIGRIFDAQGNPVGSPIQLNQVNFNGDEIHPAISALPDGGFVVAYEETVPTSSGPASIFFERYNAAEAETAHGAIEIGAKEITGYSSPSIAVFANGDFVVSYKQSSPGFLLGRMVDGATNAVGPLFDVGFNNPFNPGPETVVLSNGNILTVDEDMQVEAKIVTTAGTAVGLFQVASPGFDPHAAALAGGGYVVVYTDPASAGDIRAVICNDAGMATTPNFLVQGSPDLEDEPDVVALKDGGFFVAWDDDTAGLLRGQRFDAVGTPVGTHFTVGVTSSNHSEPELGLTDDGRILASFVNSAADISEVILDPRDSVIVGDDSSQTITSRIDGAAVYGLGGNDILLGQLAADALIGGAGADLLEGAGGNDLYYVDDAADIISESGGSGTDTVLTAVSFDLRSSSRVLGTFENLVLRGTLSIAGTGNGLTNIITGNTGVNVLKGGLGNDKLSGGLGNDKLYGEAGRDTLAGGAGNDRLYGEAGKDTMAGGTGRDIFAFNTALNKTANVDRIADFSHRDDTFWLENAVFKGMGSGLLKSKYFFAGNRAHDTDDHIIYNKAIGALYYDSDGTGHHAQVLFATISNHVALAANDFALF